MSNNTESETLGKKHNQDIWYRNPMVWFIILLPLSVVVASIITIGIAHKYAPTLVFNATLSQPTAQMVQIVEQHIELDHVI